MRPKIVFDKSIKTPIALQESEGYQATSFFLQIEPSNFHKFPIT